MKDDRTLNRKSQCETPKKRERVTCLFTYHSGTTLGSILQETLVKLLSKTTPVNPEEPSGEGGSCELGATSAAVEKMDAVMLALAVNLTHLESLGWNLNGEASRSGWSRACLLEGCLD